MKKKLFAVTLSACMALSLAACGGSSEETTAAAETTAASDSAEESTEAESAEESEAAEDGSEEAAEGEASAVDLSAVKTVSEGTLTVATSPDFAPYEFYAISEDGTPTLAGFDMALAQYIADYMGLDLEIITVDFDGVLTELQTKSVDLGMAGLSPDPKRESIMDFSDIYYLGGQSLVTTKDNADVYNSTEAINNPDVTVGAQTGSIQLDLANTNSPDADIISLPKVTDIITELLTGKMDAAYIVADVPYDQAGSAIGVCKDNPELLAAVNEAIAAAQEDGSLEDFIAEANEVASGQTYEGLLDSEGNIQE